MRSQTTGELRICMPVSDPPGELNGAAPTRKTHGTSKPEKNAKGTPPNPPTNERKIGMCALEFAICTSAQWHGRNAQCVP